ncbi:NAD-dependent epimerase/dehydratase family protein [Pelagibacterium lacus]|uniref:NAD-dependent epimerase/dehydratase family protein n=1 Tax=Pelagibacterium lacus TaxID=2282655 RepID=A0A369W4B5_9HYPH|nr:NAD-dependent epimerase/dehydratase family protein [Pelagibacterium lacus]RDE09163.1 NAD-dependent epimerase/dehydratase family protein [Pelagibacterium lacus]
MGDHFLITGGAGFIGSHLTDTLIAAGHRVTVLDCLLEQVHAGAERDAEGWPLYLNPRAGRIKGDLLDDGVFENALGQGITHLIHLAASVGVGQSMTNIVDYTRNNTMAAAIILQALSHGHHTVRRVAVASSMSIYGEGEYRTPGGAMAAPAMRSLDDLRRHHWELEQAGEALAPMPTRESKPLMPASIYAINKRDHEEMFLSVGRALGIPTIALRLFNAYGSRQALSNPYTGVAAIFISRLLNDQPPLVFEDGRQMRDFVHVGDVADAFATVITSDSEVWDAYNVGSGKAISVNDMAHSLARLLRKNLAPQVLDKYRVGDIRHCFADTSKLQQGFGFRPRRDFDRGMEELVEWVSSQARPSDRAGDCFKELERSRLVV